MGALTRPLLITLVLMTAVAVSAGAVDTGSISGSVFDRDAQPVADAIVRISGAQLPIGRSVQTDSNGVYRFEYLLPGEYAIDISKEGIGSVMRAAIVEVGKDTQADVVLGLAFAEALSVTAAVPVVDMRSSEVSFNFNSDTLETLPLSRTYRGLLQLIPGVADNRSTIGPAAGGSRQDNSYLIDGANITNPAFGSLSTEVSELDIAEVNIKRAGITAEFGRTGGTVTNAVSRSGSNTVRGLARLDWLPPGLIAGYKLPDDLVNAGVRPGAFRDPLLTTVTSPAIGVGGPIVRDRVFFYGSARHFRETKPDRVNKVGIALPDEVRSGSEFYGKVTASPAMSQQLTGSYRYRPNGIDNGGLNSDYAPSVASSSDNDSQVGTVEWANFMSASRSLNVRYLYMKELNEDTPVTDLGARGVFDPSNLAAMGQFTDPAQSNLIVGGNQYSNTLNYRRHELRGTFNQFFALGGSSHVLKAGGGVELTEETFNRVGNGWGAVSTLNQSGVPVIRTRDHTSQPPQLGQGRTYSLFVQDEAAIGKRTSVNAGVLLNRDGFSQNVEGSSGCPTNITLKGGAAVYKSTGDRCTFLQFGFPDEIQPRVGVSYQPRKNGGDKLYANWGRYYNMDQKSSARSLAPSRIFQTQTMFDLSGNVLSSGPLASTTGKMIDPDIKPIYADEILFGYATPLAGAYTLDVFFIARNLNNFIEDVPSRVAGTLPDSGPFVATNLPCSKFESCRLADAERTYRAVTIDLARRLSRGWMSDISYTWSRFAGNYDLDYSLVPVFNTSSFIQDGPGTNVEDPNRFGPLFEDRPHVFKLFTSYAATSRVTVSGYMRVQSGTPWAARGRDWEGAMMNYLEPAGSHRNPAWTNLDVMGSYRLPLNGRINLTLEARLLNVFNNQTQLSTDSLQFLDLPIILTPPYFGPYQVPNPFFTTGNAFAPPRRLYLATVLNF